MDISVGSTVFISLNQNQQEYTIRRISDRNIYVSSIDNPNEFSLLIRVDDEWRVYDEQLDGPSPIPYEIGFFPDANSLLSLPYELLLEVALRLPLDNILNICLTNFGLNELICESEDFWLARTHQDYPDKVNLKKDDQTWKEFYRLLRSSYVFAFGFNYQGQLGLGDNQDRDIPTQIFIDNQPLHAKQVSAGYIHSLIIDLNDHVLAFGDNEHGQLGLGDTQNRNIPTQIIIDNQPLKAKQVSAGFHSLIIDLNDHVWAFGWNQDGQLGLGDTQDRNIPTQIFIDNRPLQAKQVSAGEAHSLVIDLENNVWAFGNNEEDLGLGDQYDRVTPVQIPNIKAKQISAGTHSLIIDQNDNVLVFGRNLEEQLGLGDDQDRYILIPTQLYINNKPAMASQVSAGSFVSVIIDLDNNVWTFGSSIIGDLHGVIPIPTKIFTNSGPLKTKQISIGNHALIIDLNDYIWSIGYNEEGQLGLGDTQNRGNPTQIFVDNKPVKAKQISAGNGHSLIIEII